MEVSLKFFKAFKVAHTWNPPSPRLLVLLISELWETSRTHGRDFFFTECLLSHWVGVKPPRFRRWFTRKSIVNLKAEQGPGSHQALWIPGPLPQSPGGAHSTGPTPHHAHWIGGPLITENSTSAAKKYRRKHTRKNVNKTCRPANWVLWKEKKRKGFFLALFHSS